MKLNMMNDMCGIRKLLSPLQGYTFYTSSILGQSPRFMARVLQVRVRVSFIRLIREEEILFSSSVVLAVVRGR